MLNIVILEGRLTRDPELRTTKSGTPVTSITLAVDKPYRKDAEQQQADFFNVVVWDKRAEWLVNNVHKGDAVHLQGSLQSRTYNDKNGNKVYVVEANADKIDWPLSNKRVNNQSNENNVQRKTAPAVEDPFVDTNSVEISDDDLPL